MKRLRHWLFQTAMGLSFVLFLSAAIMFVRSFIVTDSLVWQQTNPARRIWALCGVESTPGRLFVGYYHWTFDADGQAEVHAKDSDGLHYRRYDYSTLTGGFWRRLGFYSRLATNHRQGNAIINYSMITIPYWFILLLAGLLPGAWINAWRRRRSARLKGLCQHCGYDLRASLERCPECGTVPEWTKAVSNQDTPRLV